MIIIITKSDLIRMIPAHLELKVFGEIIRSVMTSNPATDPDRQAS